MALLDLAEEVEALRLAEKVRTPLRALNMSKTTSFFREEHAINHHHIYIYTYIISFARGTPVDIACPAKEHNNSVQASSSKKYSIWIPHWLAVSFV